MQPFSSTRLPYKIMAIALINRDIIFTSVLSKSRLDHRAGSIYTITNDNTKDFSYG
jgi:hypothetical protein